MKAALYIRVSDDEQVKEGFSIGAQQSLLLRKCAEWNYEPLDPPYIDDGYSAKDMKRPKLQKLMKDIELRQVDVVIFWRLDRFTRRSKDFQKMVDHMERYGCGFRSATEPYDTTTAIGRFQLELAISLGQLERETTAERVHFVMEERHLKGLRNGASPPYGYDLVDGKLIVNEMQAENVRRIFDLYASNKAGFREIAVILNNDEHNDREWNYTAVRYVLMNPVYLGKLRWNYRKLSGRPTGREIITEGDHQAIVDEEIFEKVNNEIRRRKTGGKVATSEFAFAGVLRCNRCGFAMTGFSAKKKKGRNRYYRCSKRARNGLCTMPTVTDEKVQEAFLAALDVDPSKLVETLDVKQDQEVRDRKKAADKLRKELDQIQKRKKKWQLAYADDAITLEDFKERTRDDKEREEEIQQELSKLESEQEVQWTKEEMAEVLSQVSIFWRTTDNEKEKKAFLRDLFKSITIECPNETMHGAPGKFTEVEVVDWQLH